MLYIQDVNIMLKTERKKSTSKKVHMIVDRRLSCSWTVQGSSRNLKRENRKHTANDVPVVTDLKKNESSIET
jgi:hypothetical protein